MSNIIKTLWNKAKTKKIYPITLTKAVYDEEGNRLDAFVENTSTDVSDLKSDVTLLNSNITNLKSIVATTNSAGKYQTNHLVGNTMIHSAYTSAVYDGNALMVIPQYLGGYWAFQLCYFKNGVMNLVPNLQVDINYTLVTR